jgi:cysteine synthase A
LAFVAAARGYKLNVTIPETMSMERRKVLAIFGANIILTPGVKGMKGAIEEAERIAASSPNYFMPQQFKNPANPEIHFKTTGPEIWEQTNGGIDILVSGVGTGGTISGVSRYIKGAKRKKIISVAIEPAESPVITQHLAGQELKPGPHKIQGIGAGFIPDTLDLSMVDRVEQVTSEEAIEHARRLAREEGILSGVSCGAAVAVALRMGRLDEFKGKTIVTILPDSGERYLSGPLFEGVFDEGGLPRI